MPLDYGKADNAKATLQIPVETNPFVLATPGREARKDNEEVLSYSLSSHSGDHRDSDVRFSGTEARSSKPRKTALFANPEQGDIGALHSLTEKKQILNMKPPLQLTRRKNIKTRKRKTKGEQNLIKVTLNAEELDKFEKIGKHPNLHVMTTFFQDEECDVSFF